MNWRVIRCWRLCWWIIRYRRRLCWRITALHWLRIGDFRIRCSCWTNRGSNHGGNNSSRSWFDNIRSVNNRRWSCKCRTSGSLREGKRRIKEGIKSATICPPRKDCVDFFRYRYDRRTRVVSGREMFNPALILVSKLRGKLGLGKYLGVVPLLAIYSETYLMVE